MFLRLFVLLSALAWADDKTVEQFRGDAGAIPGALLAQGYSKFGDLDLRSVLVSTKQSQVQAVSWVSHPETSVGGDEFSRNSAQWTRTPDGILHIQVNRQLWPKTPADLRQVIGLHEHLGAADHDYQLSSALEALASPEAAAFSPKEKAEFASKIAARSGGGGIIGIGGGGDEDGADTKVMMLHRDLGRLAREKDASKRRAILSDLDADLAIRSEVNRKGADDQGLVLRTAPTAVASAARYAAACRQTLRLPPDQLENIFELLTRQNAEMRAKLPDAAALKKWCQGFLDGSVP